MDNAQIQVVPQGANIIRTPPSDDFNKLIQEMKEQAKEFELYLQGMEEVRDSKGNKIVQKVEEPRVNETGRKAIMSIVRSYLNPNVYLAENKEHNVLQNYKIDVRNIADELSINHVEYELSESNYCAIHSRLSQLIFHALQRSVSDKHYIFGSTNTSYTQQDNSPQKKGLFGGLF